MPGLLVVAAIVAGWFALTKPPLSLPDGSVIAFQIDGEYPQGRDQNRPEFHRFSILDQSTTLSAVQADNVRSLLRSHFTYGMTAYMCFTPGMAFRFGDGSADTVDVLICLHCNRVHFCRGDQEIGTALSDSGNEKLKTLFYELFPKADETEKANQLVRQRIEEEEDKKLSALGATTRSMQE